VRNILITGGAGFIGSNLALKLLANGYAVRVLDTLSPQIHGEEPERSALYQAIQGRVDFIRGDTRDAAVWPAALDGVDAVAHLAAETGTGQSMYEIHRYADVNINGTAALLNFLANNSHHVEKVIVASSRAIYGEGKYFCKTHGVVYPLAREPRDMDAGDFEAKCPDCRATVYALPTDEASRIHPTSVYGITKQMQEELVLTCCESLGIPALAFRYQNVYGPGQSLKNPYTGILSIFSTRLLHDQPINIFEDGRESRDFVYIDDVADATIAGLENETLCGASVNVGAGAATSVLTVARTLKTLYGSGSEITVSGNYRLGDIRHNCADVTLLQTALGFRPRTAFEDGIEKFAEWVKTQRVERASTAYETSLREMRDKGLYR